MNFKNAFRRLLALTVRTRAFSANSKTYLKYKNSIKFYYATVASCRVTKFQSQDSVSAIYFIGAFNVT